MSKIKISTLVESVLIISSEIEEEYKAYQNLKESTKSVHMYEARLSNLEKIFIEARELHQKIIAAPSDEVKTKYMESLAYHKLKELFYVYSSELKEQLTSTDSHNQSLGLLNSSPTGKVLTGELKLPAIKIPTFSGSFQMWPEFKSLFENLVNKNATVPDSHKLHYLKANLSGEAARLLRNTSAEGKFESAWALLVKRYQNLRLLKDNQFKLLFDQPHIRGESSEEITRLLDTTNEAKQALHNLGVPVDSWEDVMIFHTVLKLPRMTRSLWEAHIASYADYPTFTVLEDFLLMRARTLTVMEQPSVLQTGNKKVASGAVRSHNSFVAKCSMCQGSHSIRTCFKFRALSTRKRQEVVKKNRLCFNCLSSAHLTKNCTSTFTCSVCKQRHHSLLHNEASKAATGRSSTSVDEQQSPSCSQASDPDTREETPVSTRYASAHNAQFVETDANQPVLLATALVRIHSSEGQAMLLRALIDPGSEASFISESAVQQLNLKRERGHVNIHGVGGSKASVAKHSVSITVQSNLDARFSLQLRALVLPKLTAFLPSHNIPHENWAHIQHIKLADPTFNKAGKIDLLLGSDVYPSILLEGIIRGKEGTPMAQKTQFGWVLSGRIMSSSRNTITSLHTTIENPELERCLLRFWELEEIPKGRPLTVDEETCEQHFCRTHQRLADGRYRVQLPFKEGDRPLLGLSHKSAMMRYLQLERRFQSNPEFCKEYTRVFNEYKELGHMSEVREGSIPSGHYYLPHHAVIKESSSTTKLRIVFDASCKTSDGTSLNDHLFTGPRLQDVIVNHLARFRKHRIAFVADINKMYRQIWVPDEDSNYQLVLWRSEDDDNIRTYRLKTVTFGTAAAPYLAVRTLQQLAIDERDKYLIASRVAAENFYVDDIIHGADSEEDAMEMQRQLVSMLRGGGFHLRKWASNSEQFLASLPKEDREVQLPLSFDEATSIKTLGIQWNPGSDTFKFRVQLKDSKDITKRTILADIARLYDPMGWIAPCVIRGKLLMQDIWKEGIAWDAELTSSIVAAWHNIKSELTHINQIEIPRWISAGNNTLTEIHGFCDASEKAYAAVVYIRGHHDGSWKSHLFISKTRVAPLKRKSLARLELCAALLLAQLIKHTIDILNFNEVKIYAWCDSQITLAWIKSPPYIRTTFVANRVAEIQELTDHKRWNYVPSKDNPADVASRGLSPADLLKYHAWWHGPEFLESFDEPQFTPTKSQATDLELKASEVQKEGRPSGYHSATMFKSYAHFTASDTNELLGRWSALRQLLRITAYCLRFVNNSRVQKGYKPKYGTLTAEEVASARTRIIRLVQQETFSEELAAAVSNHPIPRGSKLSRLSPIIDNQGLLRVGGRLENADLPYSQRHPIILPTGSLFTKLLIRHIHTRTLHGGQQLMMATLKQEFWIPRLKSQVKSCINKCLICFRYRATQSQEKMANLPSARVNPGRPFSTSGVDYAGPVQLKAWKGRCNRTTKAYIAIFVCFCTKAVHLELVSEYSTSAFIAAFKRFTARRGICNTLYSDCGTNFQGAAKYLDAERVHITKQWCDDIARQLEQDGTTWRFNPPASPHFGGLWEAGVKSMKHHLKRIIGHYTLTFEEYATVLAQVEACLNSRPLCPITEDPDDLSYLTPGHFLIGAPLNCAPEKDLTEVRVSCLERWHLIQKIQQDFWRKWKTEYLSRLQQRPKWLSSNQKLKVGELVLLLDEQTPPTRWQLGRIKEVHPGPDGKIRVVTIKTATTILKRPITKLCPIPITTSA